MNWPDDYVGKIIHGDCLDVMKGIPDKSVDLVLTDPPYGVNKSDWDSNSYWRKIFSAMTDEISRITDTAIIFCATRYIGATIGYMGLPYRWQFIWYCANNMIPGDIGFAKYTSALIFSKEKSIHKNLQDLREYPAGTNELKQIDHPTPKPTSIIEYLANGFANKGDLILDPFSGSGTTAIACHRLNRRFICIEKEAKYVELSRRRLEEEQAQMRMF